MILIFIFLTANNMGNLSTCLLAIYLLTGEMSVLVYRQFSNFIAFLMLSFELFIYSICKVFVRYVVCECFLPGCSLFFPSSLTGSSEVPFINFFFWVPCFLPVLCPRTPSFRVLKILFCFLLKVLWFYNSHLNSRSILN